MKTVEEAIKDIYSNIDAIKEHDEVMGLVFHQSFAVAANTIEKMIEKQNDESWDGQTDISEYISMLNDIFGISLESLVEEGLRQSGHDMSGAFNSSKEADEATLDFITSDEDLDDYERFLKQNQAKEDLDFLKKEL
jgi:hypothetical protein